MWFKVITRNFEEAALNTRISVLVKKLGGFFFLVVDEL